MHELILATSFWLPEDFSAHGGNIDRLIGTLHWFMAALFVGWGIFFVYCLVRFRQRSGHTANYHEIKAKPSKYLEIVVVAVEAVILIWFAMPVWAEYRDAPPPADGDRLEIRIVAQQFAWNIHYPGPDGVFGATRPQLVDEESNPIGLDLEGDPNAADDLVTINELNIPVDRDIYLRLSSKDVIHSLWLPKLRIKQDIVPGMEIPVWFKAVETGRMDIACAQLCGLGHYRMRGECQIMSAPEFDQWFAAAGQEEEFFEEDEDE